MFQPLIFRGVKSQVWMCRCWCLMILVGVWLGICFFEICRSPQQNLVNDRPSQRLGGVDTTFITWNHTGVGTTLGEDVGNLSAQQGALFVAFWVTFCHCSTKKRSHRQAHLREVDRHSCILMFGPSLQWLFMFLWCLYSSAIQGSSTMWSFPGGHFCWNTPKERNQPTNQPTRRSWSITCRSFLSGTRNILPSNLPTRIVWIVYERLWTP